MLFRLYELADRLFPGVYCYRIQHRAGRRPRHSIQRVIADEWED